MSGYVGRELAAPREYAEATAAGIDREVAALITAARDRATTIIRRARPALDALADELVAHEMVDSWRLDEILTNAGFVPAEAAASGGLALAADSTAMPSSAQTSAKGSPPSGPTGA